MSESICQRESKVPAIQINVPSIAISYAGPHPLQPGFLVGSDDGKVGLVDDKGEWQHQFVAVSEEGDPINSVVMSGDYLAASTRNEVVIFRMSGPDRIDSLGQIRLPVGSHQLLPLHGGRFAASLGLDGILMMDPRRQIFRQSRIRSGNQPLYCYRIALIESDAQRDYLAVAHRRAFGSTLVMHSDGNVTSNIFRNDVNDVDVIDLCVLGGIGDDCALVFLSITGEVFISELTPNSSRMAKIVAAEDSIVSGERAYRVVAENGRLHVLTDLRLVSLPSSTIERIRAESLEAGASFQAKAAPVEAEELEFDPKLGLILLLDGQLRVLDPNAIPFEQPPQEGISTTTNQGLVYHSAGSHFVYRPNDYQNGGSQRLDFTSEVWPIPSLI